jgi:hypothetical protein
MSRKKAAGIIWDLPLQMKTDFAGVRGRVRRAVATSPRSVSFSDAVKQVLQFSTEASKPKSLLK